MEFIISDILVFTFVVFLLLVTSGPGVLSTAGVGSGFGSRAGLVYLIGLFLGTNLVALAVVGRLCHPGPLDSLREVGSDGGILRLPALAGIEDCNGRS